MDNFKPHTSLKRSSTDIWGLPSNFAECESFLESNSPCIFVLCETNLDDSLDSGKFSMRGFLHLIWKDSITHIHGLAVYVKEGLPFAARELTQLLCHLYSPCAFLVCVAMRAQSASFKMSKTKNDLSMKLSSQKHASFVSNVWLFLC